MSKILLIRKKYAPTMVGPGQGPSLPIDKDDTGRKEAIHSNYCFRIHLEIFWN